MRIPPDLGVGPDVHGGVHAGVVVEPGGQDHAHVVTARKTGHARDEVGVGARGGGEAQVAGLDVKGPADRGHVGARARPLARPQDG